MASAEQIRSVARGELGHNLPASVSVTVKGNRVELVGPPGTGKTRTAKALKRQLGGNLRIFTGIRSDTLEEE